MGGFESAVEGVAYDRICEVARAFGAATLWTAEDRAARRIARLEIMMAVQLTLGGEMAASLSFPSETNFAKAVCHVTAYIKSEISSQVSPSLFAPSKLGCVSLVLVNYIWERFLVVNTLCKLLDPGFDEGVKYRSPLILPKAFSFS